MNNIETLYLIDSNIKLHFPFNEYNVYNIGYHLSYPENMFVVVNVDKTECYMKILWVNKIPVLRADLYEATCHSENVRLITTLKQALIHLKNGKL